MGMQAGKLAGKLFTWIRPGRTVRLVQRQASHRPYTDRQAFNEALAGRTQGWDKALMTTARTRPGFQIPQADLARLFDQLPPHSVEAEMSLLGSIILAGTENIHLIGEVMQILQDPAAFYLPKHAQIYRTLVELYDRYQAVDTVQLTERLKAESQFEAIGGIDYLVELAESVPTAINAPRFAQIVSDMAKRRRLIDAAGKILREAHESPESTADVVSQAEQMIFEIAQASTTNDPVELSILVQEAFEKLEERAGGSSLTGVPTGYYKLDEMLSGLQNGEMIILAARPSMGKTALALNIAEHIAVTNRQPVAVFSLEMSKQQLAERLLSARSAVDSQRIRRNMLNAEDLQRLQRAAGELSEAPMFIDDTASMSIVELRAKARRLASRHHIKAIVVDYLQLMRNPGSENRVQEVGAISRGIKALARELSVPVICLSQLNRNSENRESKRPMLADLRESGSIEQDADVVMMLHREEYYHHDDDWKADNPEKIGMSELIIAKQRNGPTGTVELRFDHKTTRFINPHSSVLDERPSSSQAGYDDEPSPSPAPFADQAPPPPAPF
jgi:replicative DNA helicase